METEKNDIKSLLAWAKESYGNEVYEAVAKEHPSSEKDFWPALKKARASVVFKDIEAFNFGQLRCNSSVKR